MRILIALLLAPACFAQWASPGIGFNFRGTSNYVTDGASTTSVLGDFYPTTTTIGGIPVTYGWNTGGAVLGCTGGIAGINRNASVDPRLAGVNYVGPSSCAVFRVDLPTTGVYKVQLGFGDDLNAFSNFVGTIYDNASILSVITAGASLSAAQFIDATGVTRTSASDWVTNQATSTLTFTTSTFYFKMGGTDYNTLATLHIQRLVDGWQSTGVGFDFRGTQLYVTDPANTIAVLGDFYPMATQVNGVEVTYGWNTSSPAVLTCGGSTIAGIDRNASLDPRLAGVNYIGPGACAVFRLDLPAPGDYQIQLAFGDANTAFTDFVGTFFDDASSLFSVTAGASLMAGEFIDATGVTRTTPTDWVNNQVTKTLTFATSTLYFKMGGTDYNTVATLHVQRPSSATNPVPRRLTITFQ